jgi:hypothetical protein
MRKPGTAARVSGAGRHLPLADPASALSGNSIHVWELRRPERPELAGCWPSAHTPRTVRFLKTRMNTHNLRGYRSVREHCYVPVALYTRTTSVSEPRKNCLHAPDSAGTTVQTSKEGCG